MEHKKLVDHFGIDSWKDDEDFIEQVAKNTGKLKKGGEADVHNVATHILNSWQRGLIPYFERPPKAEGTERIAEQIEEEEPKIEEI